MNDAADLAAALRRLGFEVLERRNRGSEDLKRDLSEFQDKLGPGAVGLFYFAGHGMQAGRGGRNCLLPVGMDDRRERDVEPFGLDASTVLARMEESGASLSIVILDACRDSPSPPRGQTSLGKRNSKRAPSEYAHRIDWAEVVAAPKAARQMMTARSGARQMRPSGTRWAKYCPGFVAGKTRIILNIDDAVLQT